MVSSDLGACEWFVWDLRRSGLIDRGQLDQIVSDFLRRNPRAEAPALAEHLVHQGTLTAFQADRILNGKTQGLVLGPYVLLDTIGSGSMGQVYKASSKNDSNLYAVKVLPRRSMWNVRLARRQVRSFTAFQHPAVVPFLDVGTSGGLHYLVWPLCEGSTLESIVQQEGKLPYQQAALYGVQIAQGLAAAHMNNIFHGLLKPSNVMVGTDNQARILDFGIGSLLVENEGESLVDTMSTANTLTSGLDCAAPESIMEPTNRTPAGDQYSLGCVLYFCLTGRVPFPEGSAVEKMMAHQTKEPIPIKEFAPEVPDGLIAIVNRLMAKSPDERFTGCDEVVEALEPFLAPAMPFPGPQRPAMMSYPNSSHAASGAKMSFAGAVHRTGLAGTMTPPREMPSHIPSPPVSNMAYPVRTPTPAGAPGLSSNPHRPRSTPQIPSRNTFAVTSPPADLERSAKPTPPPSTPVDSGGLYSEANSGGWVPEETGGNNNLGMIGLLIVALALMAAVYFGATFLMK